jgi:hypothetical protein
MAFITGVGQIQGERVRVSGTRGAWKADSALVSLRCTFEARERTQTWDLHGDVTRHKQTPFAIIGTCIASAQGADTVEQGRPLQLYIVDTEPVGQEWFGRHDSANVHFLGGCVLQPRTWDAQGVSLVQARHPVCVGNSFFQVQVRV